MHIQQDHIAGRAITRAFTLGATPLVDIELAPGIVRQGMVVDVALARRLQPGGGSCLCSIRSVLPSRRRERCKSSFRVRRCLSESEQATWIASAMAQQLEMPAPRYASIMCAAPGWLAGDGAAPGYRRSAPAGKPA
jgi:pilus assembly protein HofM